MGGSFNVESLRALYVRLLMVVVLFSESEVDGGVCAMSVSMIQVLDGCVLHLANELSECFQTVYFPYC
ncbi:MAG TPA: hypothetical protein ACQGQH_07830 [Xylella sp.]